MKSIRLPNYLRGARKAIGLSQKELAYLLGSESASNITRYERFSRMPALPTALALLAILDLPPNELFAGLYDESRRAVSANASRLVKEMEGQTSTQHSPVKRAFLKRLAGGELNKDGIPYEPHR